MYYASTRVFVTVLVLIVFLPLAESNKHAKELYQQLMKTYQKKARPVANSSDTVTVKLGLKLSQLIGVNEKNQIMTTNVWLRQEWYDHFLKWDPANHSGVASLYVPSSDIWVPDICLYNNADGSFQVTLATKAKVRHDGRVLWEPPAIYKSACAINVAYFPFDQQVCKMKFSSWTYVRSQVDLRHINQADIGGEVVIPYAIDMSEYYASFIWDIIEVPAIRHEVKYPCCPEVFPDVTFYITIRRKTLFYTVNLIIPCVAISFLTVLVFYLPSDSGEKITLCISILLSLTVFFLLLSDLIPPTSLVIPLIGKYLLFTMILVTLSVIITVVSLNLHNRSIQTHTMSPWVRRIFLQKLPVLLMMRKPEVTPVSFPRNLKEEEFRKSSKHSLINSLKFRVFASGSNEGYEMDNLLERVRGSADGRPMAESSADPDDMSLAMERALAGIQFITNHLREEDLDRQVREDWKYVSMVIDRLFLWFYAIVCCVGTMSIMLRAPTLYDNVKPLDLSLNQSGLR